MSQGPPPSVAAILLVLAAMLFVPDLRTQFLASALTVAPCAAAYALLRRPSRVAAVAANG